MVPARRQATAADVYAARRMLPAQHGVKGTIRLSALPLYLQCNGLAQPSPYPGSSLVREGGVQELEKPAWQKTDELKAAGGGQELKEPAPRWSYGVVAGAVKDSRWWCLFFVSNSGGSLPPEGHVLFLQARQQACTGICTCMCVAAKLYLAAPMPVLTWRGSWSRFCWWRPRPRSPTHQWSPAPQQDHSRTTAGMVSWAQLLVHSSMHRNKRKSTSAEAEAAQQLLLPKAPTTLGGMQAAADQAAAPPGCYVEGPSSGIP